VLTWFCVRAQRGSSVSGLLPHLRGQFMIGSYANSSAPYANSSSLRDWTMIFTYVPTFNRTVTTSTCDSDGLKENYAPVLAIAKAGLASLLVDAPPSMFVGELPTWVVVSSYAGREVARVLAKAPAATATMLTLGAPLLTDHMWLRTARSVGAAGTAAATDARAAVASGQWACAVEWYADGRYCDCQCGMFDPDCLCLPEYNGTAAPNANCVQPAMLSRCDGVYWAGKSCGLDGACTHQRPYNDVQVSATCATEPLLRGRAAAYGLIGTAETALKPDVLAHCRPDDDAESRVCTSPPRGLVLRSSLARGTGAGVGAIELLVVPSEDSVFEPRASAGGPQPVHVQLLIADMPIAEVPLQSSTLVSATTTLLVVNSSDSVTKQLQPCAIVSPYDLLTQSLWVHVAGRTPFEQPRTRDGYLVTIGRSLRKVLAVDAPSRGTPLQRLRLSDAPIDVASWPATRLGSEQRASLPYMRLSPELLLTIERTIPRCANFTHTNRCFTLLLESELGSLAELTTVASVDSDRNAWLSPPFENSFAAGSNVFVAYAEEPYVKVAALALEVRLVCSPTAATAAYNAASEASGISDDMSVLEADVAVFTVPEYDSSANLCDGLLVRPETWTQGRRPLRGREYNVSQCTWEVRAVHGRIGWLKAGSISSPYRARARAAASRSVRCATSSRTCFAHALRSRLSDSYA
jgi:hypothetical protein